MYVSPPFKSISTRRCWCRLGNVSHYSSSLFSTISFQNSRKSNNTSYHPWIQRSFYSTFTSSGGTNPHSNGGETETNGVGHEKASHSHSTSFFISEEPITPEMITIEIVEEDVMGSTFNSTSSESYDSSENNNNSSSSNNTSKNPSQNNQHNHNNLERNSNSSNTFNTDGFESPSSGSASETIKRQNSSSNSNSSSHYSNSSSSSSSSSNGNAPPTPGSQQNNIDPGLRHLYHEHYWDVTSVDSFSRGKVVNFLRRMGNKEPSLFDVRTEEHHHGQEEEREQTLVYRARCRLILPSPHNFYIAEGVGETEKDAELLAAMHAERVCDALGIPLFRLSSSQKKHAEAARRQGRYAPLPGDPLKPEGTFVPPPLRMLPQRVVGVNPTTTNTTPIHSSSINSPSSHMNQTGSGAVGSVSENSNDFSSKKIHVASIVHPTNRSSNSPEEEEKNQIRMEGSQDVSSLNSTPSFTATSSTSNSIASGEVKASALHSQEEGSESTSTRNSGGDIGTDRPFLFNVSTAATTEPIVDSDSSDYAQLIREYPSTVSYPWLHGQSGVHHDSTSGSSSSSTGGNVSSSSVSSSSSISRGAAMASNAQFDPTENGSWSMVNIVSTRCSPTPDALLLPCVLDTQAEERLKDFFLQHGTSMKQHVKITHAAVAGYSTRMHIAEIRLVVGDLLSAISSNSDKNLSGNHSHISLQQLQGIQAHLVGRGKAISKEVAVQLASMHAELLLDFFELPLFPTDTQRQANHSERVRGFGRWAMNPLTQDVKNTHLLTDPLPLPLKQQVGGDEVWLDAQMMRRGNRTIPERIIAVHNDINNLVLDFIEVNPPLDLLREAREAILHWQKHVVKNPYPELFVCTRMGEFVRVSVILPVPPQFGVRGGNAVGRSIDQAIDLCCLHAIDTLCSIGIPVYKDQEKQTLLMEKRRRLGLATSDKVMKVNTIGGVLIPDVSEVATNTTASSTSSDNTSSSSSNHDESMAAAASLGYRSLLAKESWEFMSATPNNDKSSSSGSTKTAESSKKNNKKSKKKRLSVPLYLPGYIIEGANVRPVPHIQHTLEILQLTVPNDFVVCGDGLTDEQLLESGNEAKVCVQNYLKHQYGVHCRAAHTRLIAAKDALAKLSSSLSSVSDASKLKESKGDGDDKNMEAKPTGHVESEQIHDNNEDLLLLKENVRTAFEEWERLRALTDTNHTPFIYITGYSKNVSVHNIAYLPLIRPIASTTNSTSSAATTSNKNNAASSRTDGSISNSASPAAAAGGGAKKKTKTKSSSSSSSGLNLRRLRPVKDESAPPSSLVDSKTSDDPSSSSSFSDASSCLKASIDDDSSSRNNSEEPKEEEENETLTIQNDDSPPTKNTRNSNSSSSGFILDSDGFLLAVGISLKKKDAERACFLHAVDVLKTIGEDVTAKYRVGLPRKKLPPSSSSSSTTASSAASTISSSSYSTVQSDPQGQDLLLLLPKPYMNRIMRDFMINGTYLTLPKPPHRHHNNSGGGGQQGFYSRSPF